MSQALIFVFFFYSSSTVAQVTYRNIIKCTSFQQKKQIQEMKFWKFFVQKETSTTLFIFLFLFVLQAL